MLWWLIIMSMLIIVFIVTYSILNVLAAKQWVADFNSAAAKDQTTIGYGNSNLYKDPALLNLHFELSFLKAKIALTTAEPIGLSINLPDSTAKLEIKGVTVQTSPISQYKISKSLLALNPLFLGDELAKPLKVVHAKNTVEKEPIILKTAPQDTLTKPGGFNIPDTAMMIPVHFQLIMNNGFVVSITEDHRSLKPFGKMMNRFFLNAELIKLKRILGQMIKFQIPEYNPQILIVVSRSDAHAIWRALPEEGMIALKIRN